MASSKEDFSSLNKSKVPHIFVGYKSKMAVGGKGNVEMELGEFKNVLYVPNLSSNLLSFYQITHLRDGHRVEFLPDSVKVHSLKDNSLVAVGKVNKNKRLYSFSHFVPKSPSKALSLRTSYRVETDSDFNDSASTASDRRGSFDSCSEHSLYQSSPPAYIAIVTGPADQGTSRLSDPVSDLGDSIDALPLLDAVAPSVVTRASSDSLGHSLHDQSSQVEVSVDSHDQQLQLSLHQLQSQTFL